MIHVSEFPPESAEGPYESMGWEGDVNVVMDGNGNRHRVNHGDPPEPEPVVSEVEAESDSE